MRQSIASCRIHDLPRPSLYGLETWKHRLGKWSLKAAAYTCSLTQFPPTPSSLYDFQAAAIFSKRSSRISKVNQHPSSLSNTPTGMACTIFGTFLSEMLENRVEQQLFIDRTRRVLNLMERSTYCQDHGTANKFAALFNQLTLCSAAAAVEQIH